MVSQKSSGEYDFFKHICQATRSQPLTIIDDRFGKLLLKLDAKLSIRHHTGTFISTLGSLPRPAGDAKSTK